jgi:hypothetical protein
MIGEEKTKNELGPRQLTILLVMDAIETVGRFSECSSDVVADVLATLRFDEERKLRVPGREALAWFLRHRKPLAALGLAEFSPNGYVALNHEGRSLADEIRSSLIVKPTNRRCKSCGAQRSDAELARDRPLHSCGTIVQLSPMGSMIVAACDRDVRRRFAKEENAAPMPGERVRIKNSAMNLIAKRGRAKGVVRRVVGNVVLVEGDDGVLRSAETNDVLPENGPDESTLSENQRYVLYRLRAGTAEIEIDEGKGRPFVRAVPGAREGNIVAPIATIRALALAKCLDEIAPGLRESIEDEKRKKA